MEKLSLGFIFKTWNDPNEVEKCVAWYAMKVAFQLHVVQKGLLRSNFAVHLEVDF